MLGVPVLMVIVFLLVFGLSKLNLPHYRIRRIRYISGTVIGEYFYISIVFHLYFVSFSLGVILRYFENTGLLLYISVGVAGLYFAGLIGLIVVFALDKENRNNQDHFGELKIFFKSNRFYQQYYFSIHAIQRFIIGLTLGVAGSYYYRGIVAIGILLSHCVCVAAFRPYGPL